MTVHDPVAAGLAGSPFLIIDGALATELESRGADLHDPLWSAKVLLEQPELIRRVHEDYFRAGADIVITASYQAHAAGFERRGIPAERVPGLLRQTVQLAQQARESFLAASGGEAGPASHRRIRPLVAASVGPYGAALADGSEYRGHYALDDAQLAQFHRPRIEALVSAQPDLLACETLPSLREALVLARLLRELPGVGAWISFACRDGMHTCEGQDLADCARVLDGFAQVLAIGVNCTAPAHVPSLLKRLRLGTHKPLLAYPNSGERYDAVSKRWQPDTAAGVSGGFAAQAVTWYDAGARLIGGCCRTTPDDIRAVRQRLSAHLESRCA